VTDHVSTGAAEYIELCVSKRTSGSWLVAFVVMYVIVWLCVVAVGFIIHWGWRSPERTERVSSMCPPCRCWHKWRGSLERVFTRCC
jgi:hypothetical protein